MILGSGVILGQPYTPGGFSVIAPSDMVQCRRRGMCVEVACRLRLVSDVYNSHDPWFWCILVSPTYLGDFSVIAHQTWCIVGVQVEYVYSKQNLLAIGYTEPRSSNKSQYPRGLCVLRGG
jgi:hypothetical protein